MSVQPQYSSKYRQQTLWSLAPLLGLGMHPQWVRAGATEQRTGLPDATSGLSPARAPSRLLLRRPTPCVVKGGAKHLDEEGGGYGHLRFPGHAEDDPAAEAEA